MYRESKVRRHCLAVVQNRNTFFVIKDSPVKSTSRSKRVVIAMRLLQAERELRSDTDDSGSLYDPD